MAIHKRRSPTTLYRLYDQHEALLYVGVAGNPGRRFEQHAGAKPWWGEVTRADLTHYPDREQALLAERTSIATENPRHNIVGRRPTIPLGPVGEGPWVFSSKETGYERACALRLYWECELSAMSGDWTPDEITAYELLDLWVRDLTDTETWNRQLGKGWVDIAWFVTGDGATFSKQPPFVPRAHGATTTSSPTSPGPTTASAGRNSTGSPFP
jgi:hypothetical protein